jgi:RNA polymerase sigma-70 factor (ECF subfamily)
MSPKVLKSPAAAPDRRPWGVGVEGVEVGKDGSHSGRRSPQAIACTDPQSLASLAPETLARDPFERVYDEHFAFVWRTLRLLGVVEGVLEDAAQDVFAVVSRQLPEFAGRSSLRTWVFAIVQRTAANYRRTHRRKLRPLMPLPEVMPGHESTPQAHAEAMEAAESIERFCEKLDPDRRALFVLALLEEVPAPEVAQALGIPLNTVYSRVRALRAGLEHALSRDEEDDV